MFHHPSPAVAVWMLLPLTEATIRKQQSFCREWREKVKLKFQGRLNGLLEGDKGPCDGPAMVKMPWGWKVLQGGPKIADVTPARVEVG